MTRTREENAADMMADEERLERMASEHADEKVDRILDEAGLSESDTVDDIDDRVTDIYDRRASEMNNRGAEAQAHVLGLMAEDYAYGDLDDDIADHLSAKASALNNEGIVAQMTFLLEDGLTEADIVDMLPTMNSPSP